MVALFLRSLVWTFTLVETLPCTHLTATLEPMHLKTLCRDPLRARVRRGPAVRAKTDLRVWEGGGVSEGSECTQAENSTIERKLFVHFTID